MPRLQKTIAIVTILFCLLLASEAMLPVEICLKKLERMCRILSNTEQCQMSNKISELTALSDCCTDTCSFEEIKLACCSVL
ncbi:unnamed protein product [Caenorhabditis nigoni]